MILRSFFDQSSIDLRFPNGERTENERRMNEGWTKIDREPNENRTRTEREPNENRTKNDTENTPSELLVGLLYSFIVNDSSFRFSQDGMKPKLYFFIITFCFLPTFTMLHPELTDFLFAKFTNRPFFLYLCEKSYCYVDYHYIIFGFSLFVV